jgi:chaperone required for assembly of F1-ATPase
MSEERVGAGQAGAPSLPKRFYTRAEAQPGEGGYVLALDGRPARTPGRMPLTLPSQPLADAVAAEWNAQVETIDPATMPLTKLANTAIDGVAERMGEVRDEIVRYAGSDLTYYRAAEPTALVAAQAAAWDPIVAWAREELGARLVLSEGVMFVEQSPAAQDRLRAAVEAETSPFRLAALHVLTTLSGSALLALMHAAGRLGADEAWAAAHVDEFHQERLWGADAEALDRRARREAEFRSASRLLALA